MDVQQQRLSPKQQLLHGLKTLFQDRTSAWRAQAALAIGQLQEDVAASLVTFDADDKRATIEAAVAGRAEGAAGLAQEIEDAVLRAMRREPGKDLIRQLIKLLFLMNLKPASYSSNSEEYRGPALRAYQVGKDELVLCQISDRYFPAKDVKAAHILRLEWSPIAAHMGVNINSPENIVFMHKNIEEAYDRQEWCLLVQADGSMQVKVLNKSLLQPEKNRDTIVGHNGVLGSPRDPKVKRGSDEKLSWADLQGQQLIIPTGSITQPAKRCVTLHALSALQSAVARGWLKDGEVVVPDMGWSSPGFDRQLMARLLRDADLLAGQRYCSGSDSGAASGASGAASQENYG